MSRRKKGRCAMSLLGRGMQDLVKLSDFSEKTGMPLDEAVDQITEQKQLAYQQYLMCQDRRNLLKTTGMATIGVALSAWTRPSFGATSGNPDVAVIGSGLAGLRAVHSLLDLDQTNIS